MFDFFFSDDIPIIRKLYNYVVILEQEVDHHMMIVRKFTTVVCNIS